MDVVYKTVTFATKLEAQWAVFFDELDTAWEYKSRTVVLKNDTLHTPTFFIPGWKCFVEICAEVPTTQTLEHLKELSDVSRQPTVYCFVGEPDERWKVLHYAESNGIPDYPVGKIYEDRRVSNGFVWCGHGKYEGWMNGIYCPPNGNPDDFCEKYPGELGIVQDALDAARVAF